MIPKIKSTIKLKLDHDADYVTVELNSTCDSPSDNQTVCVIGNSQKVRYTATVTIISESVCSNPAKGRIKISVSLKGLKGQTIAIDVECKECKCNDPGTTRAPECSLQGTLGNQEKRSALSKMAIHK